ncbi:FANCM protein, partial [Smithornis capensis]|nr:FANCM protein [Smithornis capensis]
QVPEQDPGYEEDSFCVGDEGEESCRQSEGSEEEEECVDFGLLTSDCVSSGRSRYLTRHRSKLNQARLEQEHRKKPSRIIVISDSSEEDTGRDTALEAGQGQAESGRAVPSGPSAQHRNGAPQPGGHGRDLLLSLEASEMLDFQPDRPGRSKSFPTAVPGSGWGKEGLQAPTEVKSSLKNPCGGSSGPAATTSPTATAQFSRDAAGSSLCILADSREISSGAEVISCLRAGHGLRVHVCSLGSSDYIVSNRMAVERTFPWELQSPGNRSKLSQRLQRLQGLFERLCVIVETGRPRPGETSRFFQRTQYYDRVLSALVQAGIRLLFSSCQEETAALLKDLAVVEQRKGAAIRVPTDPEGPRRDLLGFYRSIPGLSYVAALNLCHSFGSLRALANSSAQAVAAGAGLSRPKAEEMQRFLRHSFEPRLLPQPRRAPGRS